VTSATVQAVALRAVIRARRAEIDEVLARYGARDPHLFGSVARGDASDHSDIDILVELDPDSGNELLRVAALTEELSRVLRTQVEVVAPSLLRHGVSAAAAADLVAL